MMTSLPSPRRPLPSQATTTPRPLPELPIPLQPPSSIPIRSKAGKSRTKTRLEPVVEGGDARLLREVRQPPPGDGGVRRRASSPTLSKQRSLYFEQAFGTDRSGDADHVDEGPRERSTVLAEVKTNVFVSHAGPRWSALQGGPAEEQRGATD